MATTPAGCPVQNNYSDFSGMPQTTPDGRFTQLPYPPNPINYPYGQAGYFYNTEQMNTQSVSQGTSNTYQQAFGVQESFGGHIFGIGVSETFNETYKMTWENSWMNTLTQTVTLQDNLYVQGPPDGTNYDGPDEFISYQDNLYGTFAFVPVQN